MSELPKRYFNLEQPITEGANTSHHPWVLEFGYAERSELADTPVLELLPSEPTAQLAWGSPIPLDYPIIATVEINATPLNEESEFLDFGGALLGLVQTDSGPRLRFVSKGHESGDWEWLEAGHALSPAADGRVDLQLSVLVDRVRGTWAFRIGDSLFDELDLVPAPDDSASDPQGFYILGNNLHSLVIEQVKLFGIRAKAGAPPPKADDVLFAESHEPMRVATPSTARHAFHQAERRRLILIDFDVAFLDETGKRMKVIELEDGRQITVYSGGGPQPTQIELSATILADLPTDLQFVRWELYESDWEAADFELMKAGTFKNPSQAHIPLIPDAEGNLPISFSARVYIDWKAFLKAHGAESGGQRECGAIGQMAGVLCICTQEGGSCRIGSKENLSE